MKNFYNAVENRRSIHTLGKGGMISSERLMEVIHHAMKFSPTAFNAQEQRLVLLEGKRHDWFWNLAKEKLKAVLPADQYPDSEARIDGFLGGDGTILFYQDTTVIKGLQEQFPIYHDNFPIWAYQSSGMMKYILWAGLTEEGYGVNIQHYTELVETDVNHVLGIDKSWKMVGQMPFGKAAATPDANKAFSPIEERVLVFK